MKNSEVLKEELKSNTIETTSRRDFFRKTAIYSAGALSAATVLTPVSAKADVHITENLNSVSRNTWTLFVRIFSEL